MTLIRLAISDMRVLYEQPINPIRCLHRNKVQEA